ncbi:MAG: DNA repair protein RadA [Oscillospiraceae bacterium]|nr:DNA repair protein RadA [Oscillospiraceae bacterium]
MKFKNKTIYECVECGWEHPKWNGQCANCGEWNTLEEKKPEAFEQLAGITNVSSGNSKKANTRPEALQLNDIDCSEDVRFDTGTSELNRVLGGGLVKGSVVLLSGEPGIGKSTLLLQICAEMGQKVLYVTGEESQRQIKIRANRLGYIDTQNLLITQSTDLLGIATTIKEEKPDIAVIDSIQTMRLDSLSSSQGSVTQVRECTNLLIALAKSMEIPVIIVGHVNKDGGIAGPKVLEHIVDTVLYFEGDRRLSYRILRAVKNRYGSTNEIGVFEMQDKGLKQVENPSAMLLSGRPNGVSGISVLCTMEGTRPILAEVQALVTKSGFPSPRRVSNGFDYNRLCLILAVLEKRTDVFFGSCDVYINIIGGLSATEPAADLAVALALYSGICDISIPETLAVFGEIGLGGEIRSVGNTKERIRECARMGFTHCIIPDNKAVPKNADIKITPVSNLKQMIHSISTTK